MERIGNCQSLIMELAGRLASLRKKKTGLGTSIVEVLAQNLDAKVETLAGPDGTIVSITHATFPPTVTRAA
jgi:two-component sensor histidine kinase